MKFNYKAQTKEGTFAEGVIEADDVFSGAKLVRDMGMTPFSVKPDKEKKQFSFSLPFLNRISLHEKIIFTKNLSGMLKAGLPLARALEVLHKQTKKDALQKVLEGLMRDIDNGGTLSGGMKKYPKVFSSLFVSMINAGEESGNVPGSLQEVGIHLDKIYTLNRKIKGAMMYPAIVFIAIILIAILMLVFVVPTLTQTFVELNVPLPASTRFVIFISDLFAHHPIIIFSLFFIFVGAITFAARIPSVKRIADRVIVRIPVVGILIKEVNTARTARTLASLLTSGVDVARALSITKDVLQNGEYKKVLQSTIELIQKGEPLSKSFKERADLYPIMMSEMMEVGEETGNITKMLMDVASFYEEEVDAKTKDLSTIIEPVLVVFIGVAVGFFAISMISPMYSLMGSIN